jgi:hypothetical protein
MNGTISNHDRASRTWPCLSFFTAGAFLALLAVLHPLKSEFDPSWRVISEYEIGRHGWLMSCAFLLLAVSCASLACALRPHVIGRSARIGSALLWVTAFGLILSALGTADPITASGSELTTHGTVHGFGAMLGIPGLLLAATLLAFGLSRNPAWRANRRTLWLTAGSIWAAVGVFVVVLAAMYDDEYGPDVRIGWPNRLIVVAGCAWLMTTAAGSARIARRVSSPREATTRSAVAA